MTLPNSSVMRVWRPPRELRAARVVSARSRGGGQRGCTASRVCAASCGRTSVARVLLDGGRNERGRAAMGASCSTAPHENPTRRDVRARYDACPAHRLPAQQRLLPALRLRGLQHVAGPAAARRAPLVVWPPRRRALRLRHGWHRDLRAAAERELQQFREYGLVSRHVGGWARRRFVRTRKK